MYAITETTQSYDSTEIIFTSTCIIECETKLNELLSNQDKFCENAFDHLLEKIQNIDLNNTKKMDTIKMGNLKINTHMHFSMKKRVYEIIEISSGEKIDKLPYYAKDLQSVCYKGLN